MNIAKILVAVDFSAASLHAVELGAFLGEKLGATVDLIHAWELPAFLPPDALIASTGGDTATLTALARSRSEADMAALEKELRARGTRIGGGFCEAGDPPHTVNEFAAKGGYGLVVVGTHGRTGLAHLLLGSVAQKIVHHSTVPVLVARAPRAT